MTDTPTQRQAPDALEAWQRVSMHIQKFGGFSGWARSHADMETIRQALTAPIPAEKAEGKASSMQRYLVGQDQWGEDLYVMGTPNAINALTAPPIAPVVPPDVIKAVMGELEEGMREYRVSAVNGIDIMASCMTNALALLKPFAGV